MFNLSIYFDYP